MKLTEEHLADIAKLSETFRYRHDGGNYQWSSAVYGAGYRAGVEASIAAAMVAIPDRAQVAALGEAAHYMACAAAIRALLT